ncbi:unnamed protein product, partial [Pylaiella littoralis]
KGELPIRHGKSERCDGLHGTSEGGVRSRCGSRCLLSRGTVGYRAQEHGGGGVILFWCGGKVRGRSRGNAANARRSSRSWEGRPSKYFVRWGEARGRSRENAATAREHTRGAGYGGLATTARCGDARIWRRERS